MLLLFQFVLFVCLKKDIVFGLFVFVVVVCMYVCCVSLCVCVAAFLGGGCICLACLFFCFLCVGWWLNGHIEKNNNCIFHI